MSLFKKVSERGPMSYLITQAEMWHNSGKYAASLWYYARAANAGYEISQANAAHLHERMTLKTAIILGVGNAHDGSGGEKEEQKSQKKQKNKQENKKEKRSDIVEDSFSLKMWKWAALQSNVHANMRVGDIYYYGYQGMRVDQSAAVKMYLHATKFGSAQSMFNVGWHYQFGVGVPMDFYLSKRYYDRAIETSPKEGKVVLFLFSSIFLQFFFNLFFFNVFFISDFPPAAFSRAHPPAATLLLFFLHCCTQLQCLRGLVWCHYFFVVLT